MSESALAEWRLEKQQNCAHCHRTGWVCEQHPQMGWMVGYPCTKDCAGPGMPCPSCNPMSPYVEQLEARLANILTDWPFTWADVDRLDDWDNPEAAETRRESWKQHEEAIQSIIDRIQSRLPPREG